MAKQEFVEILVLQNGEPIGKWNHKLLKHRHVRLSGALKAPFSIPFYPFPFDLDLLQRKGKKLYLVNLGTFSGFVQGGQGVYDLDSDALGNHDAIELKKDSFASLKYNDLVILIRIYRQIRKKKIVKLRGYRQSLFGLVFANGKEIQSLALSLVLVGTFFGVLWGLINVYRPRGNLTFSKLNQTYTLPYIHPDSFVTAPEAIKRKIDRSDYISSVIRYYRELTDLFMGWSLGKSKYVMNQSARKFKDRIFAQKKISEVVQEDKLKQNDKIKNIPGRYLLVLPAVFQENLQANAAALIQYSDALHESFYTVLNERRTINTDFREDAAYEWGNYKDLKGSKQAAARLSQISVFNQLTNEEMMYHKARELADRAHGHQLILEKSKTNTELLNPDNLVQMNVQEGSQNINYINNYSLLEQIKDASLDTLQGRIINQPEKVEDEPIIGVIQPRKLKGVISKNKFQLNLCYQVALRRNHTLKGKTNWDFVINSLGVVTHINLSQTSMQDQQFIDCIKQKILSWRFPKPTRGSVRIQHTFHFLPKSG